MIIDMIAMHIVQSPIMNIIHVVTVRDHEVRIVRTVHVISVQACF